MKKLNNNINDLKFKSVIKFLIIFYFIIIASQLFAACFYTLKIMKKESDFINNSTKIQFDSRIDESLTLLSSLTQDPFFFDDNVSNIEKAKQLEKFNKAYGYLTVRFVDRDFYVYDTLGDAVYLGYRTYMKNMLDTGLPQVTDAFPASSDGTTYNYTIAAPMFLQNSTNLEKEFYGCIFASIYFDELQKKLDKNIYNDYQKLVLFGGANQLMSNTKTYGDQNGRSKLKIGDLLKNTFMLNSSASIIEKNMINNKSGRFWYFKGLTLNYCSYNPICGTNWILMCKTDFWGAINQFLPIILWLLSVTTIVAAILIVYSNKHVQSQNETMQSLISSVQDLEKKIYQTERPDNVDFKEIISLTSKGLTDELTGVITRSVFLNQLPFKIKSIEQDEFAAMCFVDLDNLKTLNDTYGHNFGDIALKNVGYVLREYEKRFDGLVGRYGGDEFTVFLSGFKSKLFLENTIADMTKQLEIFITHDGKTIKTQCSVGVSIFDNSDLDAEKHIKQADEMLYYVKQHAKGTYHIFS